MFLEIKNSDIGYQTPLIKGANASLKLGEVTLLIGNNGVGKTTLFKSILKQIPLLKGEIFLQAKNIQSLSNKEIAEQIAMVFSSSPIPEQYTVFDLISFGKYIHYPYYFKIENQDISEIENLIDILNLSQYRNTPLKKLSDGNLQKAFIGRALAQNSPLIILDEPTTHLDEENKIMILKLLRNLAERENKAILFSSHDWRLAKEFADQIWYIENQTLQSGFAEDILLKNKNLSQAELFSIHEDFIPPKISAPKIEKELLFSALQKNFAKDLSSIEIEFSNSEWLIKTNHQIRNVTSFSEIISALQNLE